MERYGRTRQATDNNIIRCTRFAWQTSKATHTTHSEYIILLFHSKNVCCCVVAITFHLHRLSCCIQEKKIVVFTLNILDATLNILDRGPRHREVAGNRKTIRRS